MMPAFKLRYGKYCGRKIDFGRKIAAIDEVSSCVSSSSSVVSSGKKEALVPDLKTKPLISSASMRHRAEEIMRLLSNDCASEVRIRQLLGDSPDTSKALRIWPTCDCLIAFYSSGYPLKKAEAYAALRKPFLVNELGPQRLLHDRRKVYEFYLIQCTFHDGHIDMLSSDHSPTVPELKRFNDGNFLKAWGGISSLQFVLPVTWSYGRKYGMTLEQLASWWSEKPAKLAGLDLKGAIAIGNHADIVVWEPEVEFDLNDSHPTYVKHPIGDFALSLMRCSSTCLFVTNDLGSTDELLL